MLEYDAYSPCNLTVEQYDKILEGSALEGHGESFAAVESEYGVNGLFAIAVCNLESGLGKYQANANNFFGFMASSGRWMKFDTPQDGITYFGELISGPIYAGKTIDQIADTYCPGTPSWAPDVRWLMEHNFEKLGG